MGAALARLGASELVAPDGWGERRSTDPARGMSFPARAAERLCGIHGVATLDGFGIHAAMLAAACGLMAYLDHVGRGKLPLLLPPVARLGEAHLAMDEATRASLEILRSASGGRAGSLVEAVDRCVRRGARLLAEDLGALDRSRRIEERLDLVGGW
jgi:DNA mismatch repair protein MutS